MWINNGTESYSTIGLSTPMALYDLVLLQEADRIGYDQLYFYNQKQCSDCTTNETE